MREEFWTSGLNASPKIQMYSTTQERKHSQLGQRSSTKESAANVVSMGIHLTIAPTPNQAGSSRKTKVTTGQEALTRHLPETERHPMRSAAGAEGTVTPPNIARARTSESASSTSRRSAGTQPSTKKIMSRRRMKIVSRTMRVSPRLVLQQKKLRMRDV